ncbi:MAG: hypothetical protein IGBAC_0478 [Ignavibacteriae bacterium]|nr:MAG: hypothetical protein IGBAC_0478 [Ignavibacteriota bacterium]
MAHQTYAALSVTDNIAHFIVLKKVDAKIEALFMDEFYRDELDKSDLWFLKFFVNKSDSIPGKPKNISIVLDRKILFIHTFPMDTGLTKEKENEHMNWELSQHILGYHAKEYLSDTHVLRATPDKQKKEILSVSIKRSYVYEINDKVTAKNYSLDYIDATHFASGDLLFYNHPETKSQDVLLVALNNSYIECSRYSSGKLTDYQSRIETEIDGIVQFIKYNFTKEKSERIFIYGAKATTETLVKLRTDISPHFTILNPFLRIDVNNIKNFNSFTSNLQNFIPTIGIALRNI